MKSHPETPSVVELYEATHERHLPVQRGVFPSREEATPRGLQGFNRKPPVAITGDDAAQIELQRQMRKRGFQALSKEGQRRAQRGLIASLVDSFISAFQKKPRPEPKTRRLDANEKNKVMINKIIERVRKL